MKVLLFHPVLLPPKDYGGVERVTLWLAKGLKEEGCEVWIGAAEGSQIPNEYHFLPFKNGHGTANDLLRVLPDEVEMVHFMAPPEPGVFDTLKNRAILTVHGNAKEGETFPLNTVFLTRNHAERHGAECFVFNGLDPAEYIYRESESSGGLLFLSKTTWKVKNLLGAMRIASWAKSELKIAGGDGPFYLRAWSALCSKFFWIGPVSGKQKAEILADARALLFPVKWPEPFGLVVIESMVSGTPVVATDRGGISELISPETGVCLPNESVKAQWIAAISNISKNLSRKACRERALSLFHYRVMAKNYLKLYQRVLAGGHLNSNVPEGQNWRLQK